MSQHHRGRQQWVNNDNTIHKVNHSSTIIHLILPHPERTAGMLMRQLGNWVNQLGQSTVDNGGGVINNQSTNLVNGAGTGINWWICARARVCK